MHHYHPKLTVIGSGPGEIDLIAVKGARALRNAPVVFYDADVNETLLLEYAPMAIKIFMGKSRRHEAFSQQDIKELLLDYIHRYGQVVLVKSGAAIETAESFFISTRGLNVEYIPGIPSLPGHLAAFTLTALNATLTDSSLN